MQVPLARAVDGGDGGEHVAQRAPRQFDAVVARIPHRDVGLWHGRRELRRARAHLEVEDCLLERGERAEVPIGPRALKVVRPHLDERRAAPHEEGVRQPGAVRPHQHVRRARRAHVSAQAAGAKLVRAADDAPPADAARSPRARAALEQCVEVGEAPREFGARPVDENDAQRPVAVGRLGRRNRGGGVNGPPRGDRRRHALRGAPRRHRRRERVKRRPKIAHQHAAVAVRRALPRRASGRRRRGGSGVAARRLLSHRPNRRRAQVAEHPIERVFAPRPRPQIRPEQHVLVDQAGRLQLVNRHQRAHEAVGKREGPRRHPHERHARREAAVAHRGARAARRRPNPPARAPSDAGAPAGTSGANQTASAPPWLARQRAHDRRSARQRIN